MSEQWHALTVKEYNAYRVSNNVPTHIAPPINNTVTTSQTSSSSSSSQSNSVQHDIDLFKRSIKRDASLYPTLRDEKSWDSC
jgi:hypothetical protein